MKCCIAKKRCLPSSEDKEGQMGFIGSESTGKDTNQQGVFIEQTLCVRSADF